MYLLQSSYIHLTFSTSKVVSAMSANVHLQDLFMHQPFDALHSFHLACLALNVT